METPRTQEIKFLSLLSEQMVNKRMSKLDLGMTPTQTMIMMMLYDSHQPILQKQLESQLYISHATIRGIIKRLHQAGMVEVTNLPTDQRQVQVSLTISGKNKMKTKAGDIVRALEETDAQLTKGISANDLAVFDRTLKKMKANC